MNSENICTETLPLQRYTSVIEKNNVPSLQLVEARSALAKAAKDQKDPSYNCVPY